MTSGMQTSVAPNANGIAFKVLNASGTGQTADVAAGITAAANAGVSVINVSITYSNAAALVTAINYAASKGAFIVWAAGNQSTAFNSGLATTGLTAAAIQHLIIVGSESSTGAVSTFSNTPGTAKMYTTSAATGTGTTYASRTLLAPGEGLLVPIAGTTGYGAGTGTSFAAPIVSGSLLLLENAFPILKTNGTAENLLLATTNASYSYTVTTPAHAAVYQTVAATSAVYQTISAKPAVYQVIGGKSVLVTPAVPAQTVLVTPAVAAHQVLVTPAVAASTGIVTNNYATASAGQGSLNLTKAFAPVGTLTVSGIPLTSLTTSVIAGGALGSLSTITSKLGSMVALDSYSRNFTVNLSGLVAKSPTAAVVNPLPSNVNAGVNKMKFSEGVELSYMMPMTQSSFQNMEYYTRNDFMEMAEKDNHSGYFMLTDGTNTFAIGNSVPLPAQYTYSKLMYGNEDIAAMASDLGTHLVSYSQSNYGNITAYGASLGDFRITVGFNGTGSSPAVGFNATTDTSNWDVAQAKSVTRGVTYLVNKNMMLGFSQTSLTEDHGLLGSVYDPSSALSFGNGQHVSRETSVSGSYSLDTNRSLYVEYSQALTGASAGNGGLVSGNSALTAQSFGVSFGNKEVYTKDDKITLTFKMPMQVTSGSTTMALTKIDRLTGVPSIVLQQVNLAPQAREMDFGVGYALPIAKNQKLALSAGYLMNYGGDAGTRMLKAGFTWSIKM